MEYTVVQADTSADSIRGFREIARFRDLVGGVAFFSDALHHGDDRARDWFLLDPLGRAVAGSDDLLDADPAELGRTTATI